MGEIYTPFQTSVILCTKNGWDFPTETPVAHAQANELSMPLLLLDGLPCWYYMYIRFIILMAVE